MQINRLFEIVYLLLQKEIISASELADMFEVSTRTIYRDVETLSAAGIPIYMKKGRGGGIGLLPNYVLDKKVFTNEEKDNIQASLQAVGAVGLSGNDSVLQKISSLFGDSYIDWIEVDFTSWYNCIDENKIFQTIREAICKKIIVTFNYSNAKGEKTLREVEPLKLCFKGGAWYLYGFCKIRSDYRFFKLRRIKDLKVDDKSVEHKAPRRVLIEEDYFHGEYVHLKLHLSGEMAYRVYEEFDKYAELDDGSFIAEIDYPKGEWLIFYINTFGRYCEVLEPDYIRTEMIKQLHQTLRLYE